MFPEALSAPHTRILIKAPVLDATLPQGVPPAPVPVSLHRPQVLRIHQALKMHGGAGVGVVHGDEVSFRLYQRRQMEPSSSSPSYTLR